MRNDLPLPSLLRNFLLGSLILVAACGITEVICRLLLHLHFPFDFPITNPGSITQDLLSLRPHFEHLHHIQFFDVALNNLFTYPAPAALPYAIFFVVPGVARPLFYFFCLTVIGIAGKLLGKALINKGVTSTQVRVFLLGSFLLSYPFWFELKQGNIEIVIFALLSAGVWAFIKDRGWIAATCFALAGSMKLFPFIFLGLFLARRQYQKIAYAILVACVTTVASLWMIYPSISYSWVQINSGIADFRYTYMLNFHEPWPYDHSLWTFVKTLWLSDRTPQQLSQLLTIYLSMVGVITLTLYIWRIRRMPLTNQVLCFVVAAVLFMPTSFDYTLIHLYIPWALLVLLAVDAARANLVIPGLQLAFGCLLLLCAPLSELIYRGSTVEGRIKSVVLLVLFVTSLIYPFTLPKPTPHWHSDPVPERH